MISITNLLKDSEEQGPVLDYLPNARGLGNISVVAGRYYLIAFSLKTDTQNMPILMSTNFDDGLILTKINSKIINTTVVLSPYIKVYKSVGVWLYGGYCTKSNPSWGLIATFGRCGYSSFAYTMDEVQGSSVSPILQCIIGDTNTGSLATPVPGNVTYMVGMSMVQNQSYPVKLGLNWSQLSSCNFDNVVPNHFTGYSPIADVTPSWYDSHGSNLYHNGVLIDESKVQGPYLEKIIIACEISTL